MELNETFQTTFAGFSETFGSEQSVEFRILTKGVGGFVSFDFVETDS